MLLTWEEEKFMKKLLAVACSAVMLVGCTSTKPADTAATTTPTAEATSAPAASTGALKVGVGSTTSVSAKDAGEKDGQIQVSTTYAGVVLDGETIKWVSFDVAQNAGKFDAKGVITSDKAAATPTKKEKKDAYGMKGASGIGKEWFEQAAALEAWAVGKTVDQFVNMPTEKKDEEHTVTTDKDLLAGCTMSVTPFIDALKAAVANAKEVEGLAKVGVASKTTMSLKDAGEKSGSVQSNVTYAVVALDADGKVVLTQDDVAQNSAKFTAEGKIDGDAKAAKTKMEKKDEYGMKGASAIGKEWFEQNEGWEAWTVGKTLDEIKGLKLVAGEGDHMVADDADLKTTTTISMTDLQGAVVAAIEGAVEVK